VETNTRIENLGKTPSGQRAFAADGAALTAAAVSDGDSTKAGSGLGGANSPFPICYVCRKEFNNILRTSL
jgi:hypothetical protein